MRNALFLLLTAQGIPCLLAGDEFANSQKGNNNVYCQDNPTGWLNWRKLEKEEKFCGFVKDLIRLRKEYPVLCPAREMLGLDQTRCGVPDVSYHGRMPGRRPKKCPAGSWEFITAARWQGATIVLSPITCTGWSISLPCRPFQRGKHGM